MITIKNILDYLQEKGFKAEFQSTTDQVSVILDVDQVDYPLFVRILPQGPLLQLLVFFPCRMKNETIPDLARLLHLLNKEIDIPGFGLDEATNVVFYRMILPMLNYKLDINLLDIYLASLQLICRSFTPIIGNVSMGSITFESVLQKKSTF